MISIGDRFETSNSGWLTVVGYDAWDRVTVEFETTGYVVTTRACRIREGAVKDRLLPSVSGIGFLGVGRHQPSINGKGTKPYRTWWSMLGRCYSKEYQEGKPSYIGCTVCPEWHNFQNFAAWFEIHYKEGLHLDKDIRVKGNKVYSPETCMFVTVTENSVKASAKHYRLLSPSGEEVEVYNLSGFCRDNGLTHSAMSLVHTGKVNQHKQWRRI